MVSQPCLTQHWQLAHGHRQLALIFWPWEGRCSDHSLHTVLVLVSSSSQNISALHRAATFWCLTPGLTQPGLLLVVIWRCIYLPTTGGQSHTSTHGIAVVNTGDILLVDRRSDTIIQLTSDGRLIRELPTSIDVEDPRGICVDDKAKLYVYVSQLVSRYINVFTLAWLPR